MHEFKQGGVNVGRNKEGIYCQALQNDPESFGRGRPVWRGHYLGGECVHLLKGGAVECVHV